MHNFRVKIKLGEKVQQKEIIEIVTQIMKEFDKQTKRLSKKEKEKIFLMIVLLFISK